MLPLGENASEWQFAQWATTESHMLAVALRGGARPRDYEF